MLVLGGRVCRDTEVLGELFPGTEDQVSERGAGGLGDREGCGAFRSWAGSQSRMQGARQL